MEKGKKGPDPGEKTPFFWKFPARAGRRGGRRGRAELEIKERAERKGRFVGGGGGRELWAVVWSRGEELERSERSGAKARGLPYRA